MVAEYVDVAYDLLDGRLARPNQVFDTTTNQWIDPPETQGETPAHGEGQKPKP